MAGAAATLALAGLAGCDSTQNKNERAKLGATRLLESRKPQRVTRRNPDVSVVRVSLVRARRSSAIVVDLRSRAARPLTDVPIAVGLSDRGGRRRVLNRARNVDWFQTHVPAIPARGTVTWVFALRGRPRPGERPFARVGAVPSPAISHAAALPTIEANATVAAGSRARVVVDNASDVPQYGLQVYAFVRGGAGYLAAGRASIAHLGTGQTKTVSVPLAGRSRGRAVRTLAVPTIFE